MEGVVSAIAEEHVVAGIGGDEGIIAKSAAQGVVVTSAIENIRTVAADERVIASKYFIPTKPTALNPTPPNTGTVLGNGVPGAPDTATANIIITTADGGLTTNTSNDASLSAKSKVTVLGATSSSAAAVGLKITFTPKTGKMSGIFTHPGRINPIKYTGVAFQKTNTASGYFLYFPMKTAPVGTPAESGAVGVAKK